MQLSLLNGKFKSFNRVPLKRESESLTSKVKKGKVYLISGLIKYDNLRTYFFSLLFWWTKRENIFTNFFSIFLLTYLALTLVSLYLFLHLRENS